MTTDSSRRRLTGSVDTHSQVHVAAAVDPATQQLLDTGSFAVTG